MKGESPVINGDGNYSRDFTYIDNVIQANLLSIVSNNKKAINTVYNIAFGERNTLNDLIKYLVSYLSELNPNINNIEIISNGNIQSVNRTPAINCGVPSTSYSTGGNQRSHVKSELTATYANNEIRIKKTPLTKNVCPLIESVDCSFLSTPIIIITNKNKVITAPA